MKTIKSLYLPALIILFVAGPFSAQRRVTSKQLSPEQLVANLYRQHKKQSPFFQNKNRALVDHYFDKQLADLIWNMPNSPDEVGPLDGDPLYNAQDMEIKNFAIHPSKQVGNTARVLVTFTNIGKHQEINFLLARGRPGWRIMNIMYDDGTDLIGILKSSQ